MADDYYLHHADLYDLASTGIEGDVAFYRALALEAGGPVVELGAGTGRIAIPLAEAGVEVIGIDTSLPMLEIAQAKAAAAGVEHRLRLIEGDMRSFTVQEPVSLVLIPYRTFLHNLTTDDQLATLAACHRALRPGGRLALNVFNPDLRRIVEGLAASPGQWRPDPLGREANEQHEPAGQIVRTRLRLRDASGSRREASIAVRYVYRYEMEHLLARSGFEVEALYGDFAGAPFDERSTELVWVAQRSP
jgi:SAM-dependent methyltransferase